MSNESAEETSKGIDHVKSCQKINLSFDSTIRLSKYDDYKILLKNVPSTIDQEYLELYIDYLTGEIEIEKFLRSQLNPNILVVFFKSNIDFNGIRKKQLTKPSLNEAKIEITQVEKPEKILVTFVENSISKDKLELYFSNRKRSFGGEIKSIIMDKKWALITFKHHESAVRVLTKEHQINKQDLDVKLYYEDLGPAPIVIYPTEQPPQQNHPKSKPQIVKVIKASKNQNEVRFSDQSSSNSSPEKCKSLNMLNTACNKSSLASQKDVLELLYSNGMNSSSNSNDHLHQTPMCVRSATMNMDKLNGDYQEHQPTLQQQQQQQHHQHQQAKLLPKPDLNKSAPNLNIRQFHEFNYANRLKESLISDQYKSQENLSRTKTFVPQDELKYDANFYNEIYKFLFPASYDSRLNKNFASTNIYPTSGTSSTRPSTIESQKTSSTKESFHMKSSKSESKESSSSKHAQKIVVRVSNLKKDSKTRPQAPKILAKSEQVSSPTSVKPDKSSSNNKDGNVTPTNSTACSYETNSIAQAIDHLKPHQIKFLQLTKYLSELKDIYPKIRVNLNENTSRLYFFGLPQQVQDSRHRIQKHLDAIQIIEFKLDSIYLAKFLKKAEIQEKIFKFLQMFTNDAKKSSKNLYCFYDLYLESTNENDIKLNIYTNLAELADILYKYIIENIRVNYRLRLKSRKTIEMIKKSNGEHNSWSQFYNSYRKLVDVELCESSKTASVSSMNSYFKIQDIDELYGNFSLSLTGFKEDVDTFCADFKKKYDH